MENREPINILMVDDDPAKRLALEAALADMDLQLVKANSGMEALRQVLSQDFAVILLDVNMPTMDGFETASMIRQRPRSEHTPIIFVTAYSQTDAHAAHGYALGAVDYIYAPVVPAVLRAKVAVFVDLFRMTDQIKRQAAQLETANRELHNEVEERKRVEKELEAFTYSVSHDLRAPLRSVIGFSGILMRDWAPQLPPEAVRHLEFIHQQAQYLSNLVNDLLNFSRLSRQPLQKGPVALTEVVSWALEQLKAEQQGRRVEIAVGDLPVVQCDVALLRQVYINLLSNALKFTRRREVARIEIDCQAQGDETVCFVKDNGAGFDMRYSEKLFNVFQRLHRVEDYEGTGVGLSTVQRIIHRHGGRIWAHAAVDQGATFYFTLGQTA